MRVENLSQEWPRGSLGCLIVRSLAVLALMIVAGCHDSPVRSDDKQHDEDVTAPLLGTQPPEWQAERWLNSEPKTLASLRGKVVLVRWWTAGCPYCSTTAPSLRALDHDYAARGLAVIGMYHHKEDTPFDPKVYEDTAKKYGFTFPIAFDTDWHTLESWMRDRDGHTVNTGWTSVTFVLDRHGKVRHVHPGGEYVSGDAAHAKLRAVISQLLDET